MDNSEDVLQWHKMIGNKFIIIISIMASHSWRDDVIRIKMIIVIITVMCPFRFGVCVTNGTCISGSTEQGKLLTNRQLYLDETYPGKY